MTSNLCWTETGFTGNDAGAGAGAGAANGVGVEATIGLTGMILGKFGSGMNEGKGGSDGNELIDSGASSGASSGSSGTSSESARTSKAG